MAVRHLLTHLLPVIAGALFVLGLSPYDLWPAVIVSMALLARLWQQYPTIAVRIGYLYGAGFFGAGASWVYVSIHVHGPAAPPLALLLTGIFCLGLAILFALQGWVYRRWLAGQPLATALGFPALWVLFEWLRNWLLTGFPWLYAGYAGVDTALAGWAPLSGVFGLSLLFAMAAGAVVQCFDVPRRLTRGGWILMATLAAWLVGSALKHIEWTDISGAPISVALLQPNIPLEQKWDRGNFRRIISQYELETDTLAGQVDLVLWPESAVPAYRHQVEPWLQRQAQALDAAGTGLITGIPVKANDELRHNSIIGLARAGGEYHKQKLVPFGEYVPLEDWLRGLIRFFDLPMSQFSSGPAGQSMLTFDGLQVAPFICYEVVYPDFVASGSRGSDFLITVSNDSWFGDSIGPLQHLQMARFRALETGREMLRGTNNGVTAIIDHRGAITTALPQFEQATLIGQITPRQGVTPFMQYGSYPVLTLAGLALLITARRRR